MDATEIRRLTELAARAVGNQGVWTEFDGMEERIGCQGALYIQDLDAYWNPANDDGDSRRLQVALNMNLYITDTACYAEIHSGGDVPHVHFKERCTPETRSEATRLAVLRAAAAVGERMESGS